MCLLEGGQPRRARRGMDRAQREYERFGTLRKMGGKQESGCELRNCENETMSEASAS